MLNFFNRNKKNPFNLLVIGAGRGGTSLLAGLLDAHPQLKMGFELNAQDFLVKPNQALLALTTAQRLQKFNAACQKTAAHFKQSWGNKITSEQILHVKNLDANNWFDAFTHEVFAGKKILFILRDGRTCVRSKMKRTGKTFEEASEKWKFSVHLWEKLKENHPLIYTVKFEDLVTQPENELQKICAFLGMPYHADMLIGTRNTKMKSEYQRDFFDTSVLQIANEEKSWSPFLQPELKQAGYAD